MHVEIINKNLDINLHGFSGTAFKLMDKMWQTVKTNKLTNKGLNIWVYEDNEKVFSGVELIDTAGDITELEQKIITFSRYAYYKHIGPYQLIKQAGQNMRDDLKRRGFETILPYVEIYGHWTSDESKLETELLMSLR